MYLDDVFGPVVMAGNELADSVGMPDWFDKTPQAQLKLGIAHMKLAEFVGVICGIGLPCEVSEHYESGSTWCHTHDSFDEEFCPVPNKCGRRVTSTEPYVGDYTTTDKYYPGGRTDTSVDYEDLS